jgi:diguanylate cyclase (GGDEF)-like protein
MDEPVAADSKPAAELTPQEESERSFAGVIAALALGLLGVALVLVVWALPQVSEVRGGLGSAWWLMVPAFAVGEYFAAHLRVGRSAFTVSFGHIPLVIGLCLLDPKRFLLASLLGSAFTLLVHRRQRGLKLLFNVGLWSFEAAVAVTLFNLLAGGAEPSTLRSFLAAYGTIVVTDQLTALAVTAVISLSERQFDVSSVNEALTWGLLVAVCNTSIGLLFVVLLELQPIAMPLLGVVLGALLLSYRAYEQLHDSHEQLERHHGFAQSLAREQDTDSVIEEVLDRTRQLLHAEAAELHLSGRIYRSRSKGSAPAKDSSIPTQYWLGRVQCGGAVVLAVGTKDPDERAVLDAAGIPEAAAAPVGIRDGPDGVLVVIERMGEVASFTTDDLRALETFAHQASIALDNGRLVDRLRREAADRAHDAMHDPLTGLPNRRQFLQSIEDALGKDTPVGVLLLDLDRFKDVNDALGHTIGDELLTVVAQRLSDNLPHELLVARLGGDEFGVLVVRDATPDAMVSVVQLVSEALSEVVHVRDVALHLETSIGSAVSPQDSANAEGLLQRANVAMYRAKEQRSVYAPYAAELDSSSSERLALFVELRRAVSEGLLQVHFQPCIDPLSGDVLSAEALARWYHPTLGTIGPDVFIPLAEGSGLIKSLTKLVLHRSLVELSRLRSQGLLSKMSVNLSPRVLLDVDLALEVESMLAATGVPAEALTLEVTETAIMVDPAVALRVLESLKAVGVLLSIDDFGTGYSSLAYLKHLPVDELKIDQAFVRHLSTDAEDAMIVRSTIDLAHQLGLFVVAEGVEDVPTLELLARWGCDAAQGFLMSRPLSSESLGAWLRSRADAEHSSRSSGVALPDREGVVQT